MKHVFVSYSRKDIEYATQLVSAIRANQIPVWIDSHIQPGETWPKEIHDAISNSFAVVVVMTPNSAESEWVQKEILWASRKKIIAIPLLLKECEFFGLHDIQYADVTNGKMPPDRFFKYLGKLFEQAKATPIDPEHEVKRLRAYVAELEDRVYQLEEELDDIHLQAENDYYAQLAAEAAADAWKGA